MSELNSIAIMVGTATVVSLSTPEVLALSLTLLASLVLAWLDTAVVSPLLVLFVVLSRMVLVLFLLVLLWVLVLSAWGAFYSVLSGLYTSLCA